MNRIIFLINWFTKISQDYMLKCRWVFKQTVEIDNIYSAWIFFYLLKSYKFFYLEYYTPRDKICERSDNEGLIILKNVKRYYIKVKELAQLIAIILLPGAKIVANVRFRGRIRGSHWWRFIVSRSSAFNAEFIDTIDARGRAINESGW